MKVAPKQIYDYLLSKGVSPIHALGMLANIRGESNFDAGVQEVHPLGHGRGGYGLFQHTGARRVALEDFCAARGCDVWDWRAQVDYALAEHDTQRFLHKKFANAAEATEWFVRYWERPANPDRDVDVRLAYLKVVESDVV